MINSLTFDQLVNEYLKFIKIKRKQNTYRTNSSKIIYNILPYFKNMKVKDITKLDILKWQYYIEEKNYSYSYKKNLHVLLVMILNYAIKYYDLNNNVASVVGNFKNYDIKSKGNIWTIEEFNQFISYVDNVVYKTLFNLLFFTGLRVGEALALKFSDIDFENSTISINKTATRFLNENRITTPKTFSSNRIIVINSQLKRELLDLKRYYMDLYFEYNDSKYNEYYVFGAKKLIARTTLTTNKNMYCKLAGVQQIKMHEFRHSHACLLFKNNVPIDEISYRLGHSSITMTMDVYLKYLPNKEKNVLYTLEHIYK